MTTPTGVLFYDAQAKPLDVTGNFQAGCQLYFYNTGTLNETNVYSDGALQNPISQPITADSAGRFVPIYMDPSVIYRYQLYNAAGSLLEDVDPFVPTPIPASVTTLISNVASLTSSLATLQATVTGLQTSAAWSALTGIPAPIVSLAASTPPDTGQTFWCDNGTWSTPGAGTLYAAANTSAITNIQATLTSIFAGIPLTAGYTYDMEVNMDITFTTGNAGGTLTTVMTPNAGSLTQEGNAYSVMCQGGTYNDGVVLGDSTSGGNAAVPGLTANALFHATGNINSCVLRGRFKVGAGVSSAAFQIKVAAGVVTVPAYASIKLWVVATS